MKTILKLFIAVVFLVGTYGALKPLPDGVSVRGEEHGVPPESVTFLADVTYVDDAGERHVEQRIFDEVMNIIDRSDKYILVDMFLFNSFQGASPETTRALADELTNVLVEKKTADPSIIISVVSDEINTVYGGSYPDHFRRLESVGIPVVTTDLTRLRDSNPLYSALWRSVLRWFGNSEKYGLFPHPFEEGGSKVTLRSYLALLNFKANHRKVLVADEPAGKSSKMITLVTSANPHDGSSAHGNVAVLVRDKIWKDVVASEQAIGVFSGRPFASPVGDIADDDGDVTVQLLTEGKIRERLLELLAMTTATDKIDMAMFYLSDRKIVNALLESARRGTKVRIILDPNKDAFGYKKNGVPNRPVAAELLSEGGDSIELRWCDTHGEQCHSKMTLLTLSGREHLLVGSANLTRRNVGDYNLESNVLVISNEPIQATIDARTYFESLWSNSEGRKMTVEYAQYADDSFAKRIQYRIMEFTGLSSF